MQVLGTKTKPVVDAASKAQPARRAWLWRLVARVGLGVTALVTLVTIANWLWLLSGSNKWELKTDKDGVQVYTMKTPGSAVLKVRGVKRFPEFSLSNHIAPLLDESIQNPTDCAKWVTGCLGYRILKHWDAQTQRNTTLWTVSLFPPFAPREMLLQGQLHQEPQTHVVTLENIAVPNALPPDDCCVRLEHLHNIWRYTPLSDGLIEVEVTYDLDMGGAFPQLLQNLHAPDIVYELLSTDIPKLLRQPRYRNAHLAFLAEGPGPVPAKP
ncbi:hypothetical protein [Paraburkholderia humisilvae]|uniref:START domain-containing protein n=1 Tax=Paraburkholderia humisilvae TaxID=627669 RepID=A0A6J5EKQ4_9BURK|nr:hypothetical protein [Paraburkholderia humisilvae]CAB3765846.1 hypothetical protein LMG29542_05246 [Paraburkholderia humisilvae]